MIYHYFGGGSSGVARFDAELRKVFPEMVSVTNLPDLNPGDIVITDNHLSLKVSEENKTLVVMHGCAGRHYARDLGWRNPQNLRLVRAQTRMFRFANRRFIAPSEWIEEQHEMHPIRKWTKGEWVYDIIPHWVSSIPQLPKFGKQIIIGDWRDNNKGANVWRKLAAANPQWEFRPLSFKTEADKLQQYGEASLYLCLSLSEGGSYSMCDAEAAELPIVSTDVGNYREFADCEVISWRDRDNLQIVTDAIERKSKAGRRKPSFYQGYTFEKWAELWRTVVSQ